MKKMGKNCSMHRELLPTQANEMNLAVKAFYVHMHCMHVSRRIPCNVLLIYKCMHLYIITIFILSFFLSLTLALYACKMAYFV